MIRMISSSILVYTPAMILQVAAVYPAQLFSVFKKITSRNYFLALSIFAGIYSPTVLANPSVDSDSGAFLGARLGYSYNHHSCADMAVVCDREDAGYGIFTGYEFNNEFSVELSGTQLGDTAVIYPNVTLVGELYTVDLALKYTHALYKNIDVFGKLGITYWEGKITGWENATLKDSGKRPAAGAGIQFPLFSHIDGRVEYQYFDQLGNYWMGYTDSHFFSFSLVWKFSTPQDYSSTSSPYKQGVLFSTPLAVTTTPIKVPQNIVNQYVENVLTEVISTF